MAGSLNKVMLIGNLGADPEVRSFQNGGKVCNLRIATSETWKDSKPASGRNAPSGTPWRSSPKGLSASCEHYLRRAQGLHRRPAADPQVAGPERARPLFDRSRAARLRRHADDARRRGAGGGGGGGGGSAAASAAAAVRAAALAGGAGGGYGGGNQGGGQGGGLRRRLQLRRSGRRYSVLEKGM